MSKSVNRLRRRLYCQLEPKAWEKKGLSPANRIIGILILLAGMIAILETEIVITSVLGNAFFLVEIVFALVFSIEYLARVYAAGEEAGFKGVRGRLRYIVTPGSIIDLAAILPSLLSLGTQNVFFLRLLRVLRILRIARLGRLSTAWEALSIALLRRRYELGLSMGAAVLLLIFSSSILYLVEGSHQPEEFGSIPRALWWSIATLTTVGYGDVTPVTALGKFFAGITAITGIGLIALPTGILAAAFSDAFQKHGGEE